MRLIFLNQDKDIQYGNVNELREASVSPGKSSLFFLTVLPRLCQSNGNVRGINLLGDTDKGLVKCLYFRGIRCAYVGP